MPTNQADHPTWIMAIQAAAAHEDVSFPQTTNHGMGSVSWQNETGDRMVTFKRRLVSKDEAIESGVEWSFWSDASDSPSCVATLRAGLHPAASQVASMLSLLSGWLFDGWTPSEIALAIQRSETQVERRLNPERVQ